MLALRKMGPDPGVALVAAPEPSITQPDEALIEVAAAGICGSDLHIAHWSAAFQHLAPFLPVTLGHEFCGRVAARGPTAAIDIGARVTVRPPVSCGRCAACRAGDPNACAQRRSIGLSRDGGFARWVSAPAINCVPAPDSLDDELVALAEPMAVCLGAVKRAGVAPGERVAILGPGTIGQGLALFCERAGAGEVAVLGHDDAPRLAVLRALGFKRLIDGVDPARETALAALRGAVDCVFEASGAAGAFETAFDLARPGGRIVVVGIHAAPVATDLVRLVRRRLQIIGAFSTAAADWPEALAAIAADPARFARLITHRFALAEALAGIAVAERRAASKVMLRPH
ncbi:MAG: alcohol dehydrogenase catalytic domain-containing protein [Methylobacteriaceae bacterium]|nr:alcohol dehydrogenase catalytic domain-containing protein [Methylobacteriaceae bacterium]